MRNNRRITTTPLLPVSELLGRVGGRDLWLPAVFSVMLNVPTPPVNVALAGRTAAASLLVILTVLGCRPVLLLASFAVTVKVTILPAVELTGALTANGWPPPR